MLALSMAFLARPRLLLIDELSLGLAPVVVEQLLPIIEVIRSQGTTVILVEQSVNLALSIAQTAYFMEKGEIRFHGPTSELLERPDILRSVFLEGAATHPTAGVARPRYRSGPAPTGTGTRRASAAPTPGARGGGPLRQLRWHPRGQSTCRCRWHRARSWDHRTQRRRKDDAVRSDVGLHPGRQREVFLGGLDVTRAGPSRRARLGLGRSFQDARLFPAMTVEETIAVALERWVDVTNPLSAACTCRHGSTRSTRSGLGRRRAHRAAHLEAYRTKFIRELSTGTRRVIDLACVLAHRPTVVLLDEPSSGIAQRESEALGPLLIRSGTCWAPAWW
jgi:ABC-type branched-subunit amino acid transport system ATPase component